MGSVDNARAGVRDQSAGRGWVGERPTYPRAHAPLVVHVIYRLDVGGLENGLVNLINLIPRTRYRHAVVCLTDYTSFHLRIDRDDVAIFALHKRAGNDLWMLVRVWKLLRQLRPDIVHTRNLAALECVFPAWLAGVRACVHGEHGRDMCDVDGSSTKYQLIRRLYRPFVKTFVPMSKDLEQYLVARVAVKPDRIWQIYNGVDSTRFAPGPTSIAIPVCDVAMAGTVVIGTVGRLQTVKDQLTLVDAFDVLVRKRPDLTKHLRLVIVGGGSLGAEIAARVSAAGLQELVWLAGERSDVPQVMRAFDVFVLPSLAEGISNTVLEAMATGLPVVATRVGGNPELVVEGVTGVLVPPADPAAMADAIARYADDRDRRLAHGRAGRQRVLEHFSVQCMVGRYVALYDRLTGYRDQDAPGTRGGDQV